MHPNLLQSHRKHAELLHDALTGQAGTLVWPSRLSMSKKVWWKAAEPAGSITCIKEGEYILMAAPEGCQMQAAAREGFFHEGVIARG